MAGAPLLRRSLGALGWSLAAAAVFTGVQAWAVPLLAGVLQWGDAVSASLALAGVVGGAVLLPGVRGRGAALGLTGALTPRTLLALGGCQVGLLVLHHGVEVLAGRPPIPEAMDAWVGGSEHLLLLAFVTLAVAPLFEETLFRGFLQAALAPWPGGAWLAVGVPALAWAALHTQYDPLTRGFLAVEGVFLGLVRVRTGSLAACVLLHALVNAVALGQVLAG